MTGKIAVEEHFVIPSFAEYASSAAAGIDQVYMREKLLDFSRLRIPEMDRYGIEMAILSLTAQGVQAEPDVRRAVLRAREANDFLAHEVVAKNPSRFAGFATIALQDPDEAARELERAVRDLGFKGALVNGYSNIGDANTGEYYDLPKFHGFWEHVQRLDVPIYLHPRDPLPHQQVIYEGHPGLMGPAWAWGFETATHALRLILSGLFDRFPKLRIVLGHLGEMLPFSISRTESRLTASGNKSSLNKPLGDYFRENFYISTSGNFRTQALIDCLLEVGADRILFAVDYPYEPTDRACGWFDQCPISEADRVKIGRLNARRLFRLE